MNRLRQSAILFSILVCAACSQPPPQIVVEPELTMNPSGNTPLAGLLTFATDQPARATLTIGDGDNTMTVTPNDAFVTEHELMVLGLRPGRINTVDLVVENADGWQSDLRSFQVETDPLPDDFPSIDVSISRPARMEPGVTVTMLGQQGEEQNYMVALDAQGDVVWYYRYSVDEARRLPNGNFFGRTGQGHRYLREFNLLGETVREWHAANTATESSPGSIPVATDSFHHDIIELPSGNFLALSTEVRHFDSFPPGGQVGDERDGPWSPRNVAGDLLVEFRPADGEVLREWKVIDLLDPYRVGFLGTGYYEEVYKHLFDDLPVDLTHGNGLAYDEASDSVIISFRNLSAVVKLHLPTSEVRWILGDPAEWRAPWSDLLLDPVGEVTWSYGHHAPKLTPTGDVLLYDNGDFGRSFPPDRGSQSNGIYSRAVIYRIDEANRTVREIWSFGSSDEGRFYAPFLSEADWLPQTGNVLLTNGGQVRSNDGGIGLRPRDGRTWISLMEVTSDTPAEKVWEVAIEDANQGWVAYRSERIPSLYP